MCDLFNFLRLIMSPSFDNKRKKFRSLAEKRTTKLLNGVRLVQNLSNPQHYVYDEDEVKKMFSAIRDAISEAEAAFKKGNRKNNKQFTF